MRFVQLQNDPVLEARIGVHDEPVHRRRGTGRCGGRLGLWVGGTHGRSLLRQLPKAAKSLFTRGVTAASTRNRKIPTMAVEMMTTVVVPTTSSRPGHETLPDSFRTSVRKPRKLMPALDGVHVALVVLGFLVSSSSFLRSSSCGPFGPWQGCGDSNPEPTVLETAALASWSYTPVRRSQRRSWSGRRDSNPRPTAWKAVTLPLSYSRERMP